MIVIDEKFYVGISVIDGATHLFTLCVTIHPDEERGFIHALKNSFEMISKSAPLSRGAVALIHGLIQGNYNVVFVTSEYRGDLNVTCTDKSFGVTWFHATDTYTF